ncbi:hypothetical protein [Nocardioides sp. YIM 152315]|uniref:hypothetical protein n=1 Tax=Nocardioides sp. YIM 152315 TaxID=3031760 RepID=UPI0023D99866|nr:hypothetical protein [Nocardioides sp. YIM 152315]MDF1603406.1 hypothetical protein [Nocardioides sp. YIM 152315]
MTTPATVPDDAWPAGDRTSWADDEARLVWDFTAEPWESRPYTDDENAAADARAAEAAVVADRAALVEQARDAVAGNRVFLDLDAPTAAQTLAQVRALTRQMTALVRLTVGDLCGDD